MFRVWSGAIAMLVALLLLLTAPADAGAPACRSGTLPGDWWGYQTSLDLPPGFWAPQSSVAAAGGGSGTRHTYEFRFVDPAGAEFIEAGWFIVDPAAPLHKGEVIFRRGLASPQSADGPVIGHRINPLQDTMFQLRNSNGPTRADAVYLHDHSSLAWRWDALTQWVVSTPGQVAPLCGDVNPGMFERNWAPDYSLE